MNRIFLLIAMVVSWLFQLFVGIWMIIDIRCAGDSLIGNIKDYGILYTKEFFVVSQIAAKAFLMLSVYSLISIVLIIRKKRISLLLALITGLMITIISITTFIETGSYMVWTTDFSKGIIIPITSIISLYKQKSPVLE